MFCSGVLPGCGWEELWAIFVTTKAFGRGLDLCLRLILEFCLVHIGFDVWVGFRSVTAQDLKLGLDIANRQIYDPRDGRPKIAFENSGHR
jgi:hypothetical protein